MSTEKPAPWGTFEDLQRNAQSLKKVEIKTALWIGKPPTLADLKRRTVDLKKVDPNVVHEVKEKSNEQRLKEYRELYINNGNDFKKVGEILHITYKPTFQPRNVDDFAKQMVAGTCIRDD